MNDEFITRCSTCILPSNFPGIKFDSKGQCNFCLQRVGVPSIRNGLSKELRQASKILVALSGGRDSCFGLQFLHSNTDAEIIAFTYDWPLVNDRARRNAARIVSALGIEHVVRAPDSFTQLKFIRRVIYAFSKKPNAKIIPLLMAPDKFFFSEAKKVADKYKCDFIVFCGGSELEFTAFKSGLSGARSLKASQMLHLSLFQALKLLSAFFSSYIQNPRLFLAGIKLPITSFLVTYLRRPKIEYLFEHINWDESEIESCLESFNWEGPDEKSRANRWRSGDGTSEFYNYLYFRLLGYNERTTHLSNKIRAKLISREVALELDQLNAKPNIHELKNYASTVGFQLDEFLRNLESRLDSEYK